FIRCCYEQFPSKCLNTFIEVVRSSLSIVFEDHNEEDEEQRLKEQFRRDNKENFPENKSASAIAKEGGVIWKSMTESAARKKAEYEIAIKQHNDNLIEAAMEISSSSINTHEDVEQEVSSQIVNVL
ncbi:hypothetical protein M8C21_013149, partial [Ambrosia artemisiifolia]